MSIRNISVGFVLLSVMSCTLASNMHVYVDRPEDDNTEMEVLVIPYSFYNENVGAAAVAVIVASNFLQPQPTALANVFVGSNNATNLFSYSAEYRHSPKHNPFTKIPLASQPDIPWWQWIGFVEVGRVADN